VRSLRLVPIVVRYQGHGRRTDLVNAWAVELRVEDDDGGFVQRVNLVVPSRFLDDIGTADDRTWRLVLRDGLPLVRSAYLRGEIPTGNLSVAFDVPVGRHLFLLELGQVDQSALRLGEIVLQLS
jgi:hypothetical protein